MTKQEKIREHFEIFLREVWRTGRDGKGIELTWEANRELRWLHSQGVVVRVKRELPDITEKYSDYHTGKSNERADMLKAGYVAVEPLISG